jgi:hypothetical protein
MVDIIDTKEGIASVRKVGYPGRKSGRKNRKVLGWKSLREEVLFQTGYLAM